MNKSKSNITLVEFEKIAKKKYHELIHIHIAKFLKSINVYIFHTDEKSEFSQLMIHDKTFILPNVACFIRDNDPYKAFMKMKCDFFFDSTNQFVEISIDQSNQELKKRIIHDIFYISNVCVMSTKSSKETRDEFVKSIYDSDIDSVKIILRCSIINNRIIEQKFLDLFCEF